MSKGFKFLGKNAESRRHHSEVSMNPDVQLLQKHIQTHASSGLSELFDQLRSPSHPNDPVDTISPRKHPRQLGAMFLEAFNDVFELFDMWFLASLPEDIWDAFNYEHFQHDVLSVTGGIQMMLSPELPIPANNYVSVQSMSTYPFTSKDRSLRSGDPICDWYAYAVYPNRTLFAVADGCNWGPAPREAAQRAVQASMRYLIAASSDLNSVVSAGFLLVRACMIAHREIFEGKAAPSDAGGTTLVVGMILQVMSAPGEPPKHQAVVCSIGDCKVFVYSPVTHRCRDFFSEQRARSSGDATDSGGRIGYKDDSFAPDLDNMQVKMASVEPSDTFLVMSDGVHDNLDPLFLGIPYTPSHALDLTSHSSPDFHFHRGTFIPGVIDLTIVRATKLISKDPNGLSDPYCTLLFKDRQGNRRSKKMKTKVEWETLNPRWNALFTFEWLDPTDTMLIECWDKDPLGGDDFEGELFVPLLDLLSKSKSGARPVTRRYFLSGRDRKKKKSAKDNTFYGQIELLIGFTAFTPEELLKRNLAPVEIEHSADAKVLSAESLSPTIRDAASGAAGPTASTSSSAVADWPSHSELREATSLRILEAIIHRSRPDSRDNSPSPSALPSQSGDRSPTIHGSRSQERQSSIASTTTTPIAKSSSFHGETSIPQLDEEAMGSDQAYLDALQRYSSTLRAHIESLMNTSGDFEGVTPSPAQIVQSCMGHAQLVTSTSRLFLETYRSKRLPNDYTLFPGKMDHTTLLCFHANPHFTPSALQFRPFLTSFARTKTNHPVVYVRPLVRGKIRCSMLGSEYIQLSITCAVHDSPPRGSQIIDYLNECFPPNPVSIPFHQILALPLEFRSKTVSTPHISKKGHGLYAISFWQDESHSPTARFSTESSNPRLLSINNLSSIRGRRSRSRKANDRARVEVSPGRRNLVASKSTDSISRLADNS